MDTPPTPDPTVMAAELELEALLVPVLELAAEDQASALAAVCAAHPALAIRLRRRHAILCQFGLDSENLSGGRNESNVEPGQCFGSYRILSRLGRGGMGVVYLAEDPGLGRQIALKLIRPEYLDSERARERFRREIAIAARLEHPGICAVYGAGVIAGQPYLAMQFLRGESLETILRRADAAERLHRDGLRPAILLVEQLARAVHHAHEAGLVHRDIKPGNVFVTADERPVLMDFGLARAVESADATLTGSGEAVGTPAYMAPEQVAPRGQQIDRRTDVHALGALLYECLTLRAPFPGSHRDEIYHQILSEDPIELRRLQPMASRDLAAVVQCALAKDPARRYASALDLAAEMRRVLDGVPTHARPAGPWRRTWHGVRRHPTWTGILVALVIGLGCSLWFLGRSLIAQRRFEALAIAGRAREVQPNDPRLALAALQVALARSPEPEVLAAIHGVLPEMRAATLVRRAGHTLLEITVSPSRRIIVVNGNGGAAGVHREDGTFVGRLMVDLDGKRIGAQLIPQRPAVAFAPDERAFWVAVEGVGLCRFEYGGDGDLLGRPARIGAEPLGRPMALAWSQDHSRLLVTWVRVSDGLARASLHDAADGAWLLTVGTLPPWSWGCDFLADGRLALPTGIWSPGGTSKLCGFEQPLGDSRFVRANGDRVAVATTAGVQIHSAQGVLLSRHFREADIRLQQLHHFEWAPQGDALLMSFQDGRVWVANAADGTHLVADAGSSCDARFSSDGQRILTGDGRGWVQVFDRQFTLQDRLLGHRHNTTVAPLANGDALAVSWDGTARVWQLERPLAGQPMRPGFSMGHLLRFGDLLLASDDQGLVRALDAEMQVRAKEQLPPGVIVLAPAADGEGVWLGSSEAPGVWRWVPGQPPQGPIATGLPRSYSLSTIAATAGGSLLLANGFLGSVRTLDPANGRTGIVSEVQASQVAAADRGRVLVAAGANQLLGLAADGRSVAWSAAPPVGESVWTASVMQLSHDGRLAVTGHMDGSVRVWSVDERRHLQTYRDHTDMVVRVAVSPDRRHIASATRQGHLVIREVGVERPVLAWRSTEESFFSVAFLDDHCLVSTGKRLPRLRHWWWEPQRLQKQLDLLEPALPPLTGVQLVGLEQMVGR